MSPETKAELLDKYRYTCVEDSNWEADVRDSFNDILYTQCFMRAVYITYDMDQRWAAFTGQASVLSEFLRRTSLDVAYPEWMLRDGYIAVDATSMRRNVYSVVVSANDDCFYDEEDEFKRAVEQVILDKSEETRELMTNDIRKFIKAMNDELWHMLDEEYSYLTSDEVVWETITLNKWDADESE